MFKTFQKLQSKIINPEGGYQLLIVPIITGALTAIGVVVGGLATKALTYGIVMLAIFTFANTISGVFIAFGLSMLNWGIQGPFGTLSNISMTNPANNYIIQVGWTLLRDLTNMFFILGLAYIGLATALNLASFNTKKTFTTLILVALLINFTPVICGLIVDASNIIMNFFLSEVDFNSIADSFKQYQTSMPTLTEVNAVADQGHNIWRHTLTGIYSILAGGVLTVFGAILLLRHFIIWLLVILSPLAFFCRIFDFSKQWYTKWWGYFVSWSFIGIPAAFFLYLSNHLMILAKTRQVPVSDAANSLSAMLAPYFVSVVFMVIALIVTLKIKTAGSSLIMNTANKVAGKVKAMPGQIRDKVAKPMGKTIGAKTAAGLTGFASIAGWKAAKAARARGESGAKAMAEVGVNRRREMQQKRAMRMEQLGIKPRELEDISEEDLKKVASTPATTPEGLLRRAKAIKKLVDDDNFDASNPAKTAEMLAVMQKYPGMNISKLKKAHPELSHLVDPKGYKEELDKLPGGATAPGNKYEARFKLTLKTAKRMSAEDLAKVPFKDFSDPSTTPEKRLLLAAIFAGITPAKIDKIAELSGDAENLTALHKFSTPPFPEYARVNSKIVPGDPEYASVQSVRAKIISNAANFPPP